MEPVCEIGYHINHFDFFYYPLEACFCICVFVLSSFTFLKDTMGQAIPGKKESLGAFFKRLLEAYCTYKPLDTEERQNYSTVHLTNLLASDICRKLQVLERFKGKWRAEPKWSITIRCLKRTARPWTCQGFTGSQWERDIRYLIAEEYSIWKRRGKQALSDCFIFKTLMCLL